MNVNLKKKKKTTLHQPGLQGGSLHNWQTGWWRGLRQGGLSKLESWGRESGVRGGRDNKKDEEGHKTTKVRREAEVSRRIGREKSVYSGKGKRDERRAQM